MTSDSGKGFRPQENPSFEDGEEACHDLGRQIERVRRVVAKYRDILEAAANEDGPAHPPGRELAEAPRQKEVS